MQGLPCKNKAFHSPETQHGCRVIKVYLFYFVCIKIINLLIIFHRKGEFSTEYNKQRTKEDIVDFMLL